MKRMKFTAISALIVVAGFSYVPNSQAVVCIDAVGNTLQIKEMVESAYRWVEEKAMWAADQAGEVALAEWQNLQSSLQSSAMIAHITDSVAETSNAYSAERYASSPSICHTMSRAKALVNSITSDCGQYTPAEDAILNNISDCAGTGLNCGKNQERQKQIVSKIAQAFEDENGEELSVLLDGAGLFSPNSSSGYTISPENLEMSDMALDLLIGVDEPDNLPRAANGEIIDSSHPANARRLMSWSRQHVIDSALNDSLIRVNKLYRPTKGGHASIMQQLKDQVDYYNSEKFLRLIGNVNKASDIKGDSVTAKHQANSQKDISQQQVSSAQVVRILSEQSSFTNRLLFLIFESAVSTEKINTLIAKGE